MGAAFILLAHANLGRATALARRLTGLGARVAVHLDRRVRGAEADAFLAAMAAEPRAILLPRRTAEWGMMGLVEAALDGAAALMAAGTDWSHALLISGADLPVRPLAELDAFLAAAPGRDFIEAHPADGPRWVRGGLQEERFTLFHPVSFRRRQRVFDALVAAQRKLGVSRRPPPAEPPLRPHLGGQWWCLSRATLAAILSDPDLPRLRRWFRLTWIPDESFFQTLAVRHGRDLAGHGLTLAAFNPHGRPHVLYDDHAEALAACRYFFARKADPRAAGLYARFLARAGAPAERTDFSADAADNPMLARFAAADARAQGPSGAPPGQVARWRAIRAPAPYTVVWSADAAVLERVGAALRARGELTVHGRLFHPERIEFAAEAAARIAYEPDQVAVRDYRPADFLANVIHAAPAPRPVVLLAAGDGAGAEDAAIWDAQAHWAVLAGGGGEAAALLTRLEAGRASFALMTAEELIGGLAALSGPQKV